MTEAEWLASKNPRVMLEALGERLDDNDHCGYRMPSDRKLRLFAVACCRSFPTPDEMHAASAAERFADGLMTANQLRLSGRLTVGGGTWAVCHADASEAARHIVCDDHFRGMQKHLASVLRDIVGNPFRPVEFRPEWRTPQVLSLARAAYDERDKACVRCKGRTTIQKRNPWAVTGTADIQVYLVRCPVCQGAGTTDDGTLDPARLAVLSDALEDAGCDNAVLLTHLRSPGPHYRGCWAVDAVLGRE